MSARKNREKAKGTEFWANIRKRSDGYYRMNVPPHVIRNEDLRSLKSDKSLRVKFKVVEKEKK